MILTMNQEALTAKGKEIFPFLADFKDFYLAGGTAVALFLGHRVSADFDLFTEKEINKNLLNQVQRVFSDKKIVVSINNPDELTVFVEGVKITFLKYPFPVLEELANLDGLKILSLKELAVTKAYTIGRRGSLKDYIDLYFILKSNICVLEEIVNLAIKKYDEEFNSRLFLEQLIYLADVTDTEIIFLTDRRPTKVELENFFIEKIKLIKI